MVRRRRNRLELAEALQDRYEGAWDDLSEHRQAEMWAELVEDAKQLRSEERRGLIDRSVATVLAHAILAEDAQRRSGLKPVRLDVPMCMWCGRDDGHDTRCPVEVVQGSFGP